MIITKAMGALDLLSGFLIVFGPAIPGFFVQFAGIYLTAKGGFFLAVSKDVTSAVDLVIGLYALSIFFFGFYHILLSIIALVFLAQKSAFAFA